MSRRSRRVFVRAGCLRRRRLRRGRGAGASSRSSSSSRGRRAAPTRARRGRGAARRLRAGALRGVGLLSVEAPARARPAGAAAPRAALRPQPLRDHRGRAGAAGALTIAVAGLSVGRAVVHDARARGHRRRAAAGRLRRARPLEPQPRHRRDRPTSASARSCSPRARSPSSIPTSASSRSRAGSTRTTIDAFVDGADVLVDECDGLEIKVRLRERARAARHAGRDGDRAIAGCSTSSASTSSRTARRSTGCSAMSRRPSWRADHQAEGPLRDPDPRPGEPHRARGGVDGRGQGVGLDVAAARLRRRARRRDGDQRRAPDRARASSTVSGRFYADLDELIADGRQAPLAPAMATRARPGAAAPAAADAAAAEVAPGATSCASSSPARPRRRRAATSSRGASRPAGDVLRASPTPRARRCSTSAAARRCSRSARRWRRATIGARALGLEPVLVPDGRRRVARRRSSRGADDSARATAQIRAAVAALLQPPHGARSPPVAQDVLARLAAHGAPLRHRGPGRRRAQALGAALGALDRVRFLSARLREDMLGELRFARRGAAARDGIDVASLELDAADRAAMDVLRTGAGMDFLADARSRLGPAASRPRRVRGVGRRASCCARRRSTRPRSSTPAAA